MRYFMELKTKQNIFMTIITTLHQHDSKVTDLTVLELCGVPFDSI